jgi:Fic family protein
VGYDHYFEDGNGRTARALFYWSMLRQGFWVTEYLTISRLLKTAPTKYARSFLLTEQDDGDLTYFFEYHLQLIQRSIFDLNGYLSRKVKELREAQVLLAVAPGSFNHRQIALLERAIKNPDGFFTVQSHGNSHNVAPETARRDLLELQSRRLLQRVTISRRHVWSPAPNLMEAMKRS